MSRTEVQDEPLELMCHCGHATEWRCACSAVICAECWIECRRCRQLFCNGMRVWEAGEKIVLRESPGYSQTPIGHGRVLTSQPHVVNEYCIDCHEALLDTPIERANSRKWDAGGEEAETHITLPRAVYDAMVEAILTTDGYLVYRGAEGGSVPLHAVVIARIGSAMQMLRDRGML